MKKNASLKGDQDCYEIFLVSIFKMAQKLFVVFVFSSVHIFIFV